MQPRQQPIQQEQAGQGVMGRGNGGAGRGMGRGGPNAGAVAPGQARVYAITEQDAEGLNHVVTGTLPICSVDA